MPRVRRGSAARCTAHGGDCAVSGGSSYRSAYCARVGPLSRWQASTGPVDEAGEWADLAREAAAKAERRGEDGVLAAVEMRSAQRSWDALTPAQRCASIDGEDANLAAIIAASTAEMERQRP